MDSMKAAFELLFKTLMASTLLDFSIIYMVACVCISNEHSFLTDLTIVQASSSSSQSVCKHVHVYVCIYIYIYIS